MTDEPALKPCRRITQLCPDEALGPIALCDDGTLWYYEHKEWLRFRKPIPQD